MNQECVWVCVDNISILLQLLRGLYLENMFFVYALLRKYIYLFLSGSCMKALVYVTGEIMTDIKAFYAVFVL